MYHFLTNSLPIQTATQHWAIHVLYSRSLLVIHLNTAVCQIMYTENNLLKISLPIITSDNMKYSGTNLTNNVQDLYWKDFTMNHYINGRISTFIVWKTQCWKNVSFPQINLQNQFHFQLKISHAVFMLSYFVGLVYVFVLQGILGLHMCLCVCVWNVIQWF